MSQVYLSYSHFDQETASELKDQIDNIGFSTGLDRKEREAEPISSKNERAKRLNQWIGESELLIFLVSSHSVGSKTVHKEVGIAKKKKAPKILAVIVDEVDELSKIRDYAGVLYYSEDDFQEQLYSQLAKLIGQPSTAIMDLEAQHVASLISDAGPKFDLTKASVVIGRAPHVDVDLTALDDQKHVSREHATLVFRKGQWELHANDAASNETLVNGVVLAKGSVRALEPNDKIRLGTITLTFVTD